MEELNCCICDSLNYKQDYKQLRLETKTNLVSPTRQENYTISDLLGKFDERSSKEIKIFEKKNIYKAPIYGDRDGVLRVDIATSYPVWVDGVVVRIVGNFAYHITKNGKIQFGQWVHLKQKMPRAAIIAELTTMGNKAIIPLEKMHVELENAIWNIFENIALEDFLCYQKPSLREEIDLCLEKVEGLEEKDVDISINVAHKQICLRKSNGARSKEICYDLFFSIGRYRQRTKWTLYSDLNEKIILKIIKKIGFTYFEEKEK